MTIMLEGPSNMIDYSITCSISSDQLPGAQIGDFFRFWARPCLTIGCNENTVVDYWDDEQTKDKRTVLVRNM